MILDVGNLVKEHWQKITISAVSLIGTTVGGAYITLDRRITAESTERAAFVSEVQKSNDEIRQDLSELKGKADTILTLMRRK